MKKKKHEPAGQCRVEVRRKRIGRLKSAQDVTKYIGRCIRRVERDGAGGDANLNYKLVMMASMLLKSVEVGAIEDRIAALEVAVQKKDGIR